MLINAAKCQGYSFFRFWVKGKPKTEWVKLHPSTPHLVKKNCFKHLKLLAEHPWNLIKNILWNHTFPRLFIAISSSFLYKEMMHELRNSKHQKVALIPFNLKIRLSISHTALFNFLLLIQTVHLEDNWYLKAIQSLLPLRNDSIRFVKRTSMPHSVKNPWYIKYYSLSSTRGLQHSSNSISNNFHKTSSGTGSEVKVSENVWNEKHLKETEISNASYGLNKSLISKQTKNHFLKKK